MAPDEVGQSRAVAPCGLTERRRNGLAAHRCDGQRPRELLQIADRRVRAYRQEHQRRARSLPAAEFPTQRHRALGRPAAREPPPVTVSAAGSWSGRPRRKGGDPCTRHPRRSGRSSAPVVKDPGPSVGRGSGPRRRHGQLPGQCPAGRVECPRPRARTGWPLRKDGGGCSGPAVLPPRPRPSRRPSPPRRPPSRWRQSERSTPRYSLRLLSRFAVEWKSSAARLTPTPVSSGRVVPQPGPGGGPEGSASPAPSRQR
jgi:hypothetical protein